MTCLWWLCRANMRQLQVGVSVQYSGDTMYSVYNLKLPVTWMQPWDYSACLTVDLFCVHGYMICKINFMCKYALTPLPTWNPMHCSSFCSTTIVWLPLTRVTFWLQRVWSLPCACAYVALFACRLVYNHYAIAHTYNAAKYAHTRQWPGALKPESYSLVEGNRSIVASTSKTTAQLLQLGVSTR